MMDNNLTIKMAAKSQNEALARTVAAAFIAPLDPSMDVLNDIKTAVSEAVTNAIIHGYKDWEAPRAAENQAPSEHPISAEIELSMTLTGDELFITVSDSGVGISDINQALQPLYTTSSPEMERAGMGFTVMESFMDQVRVLSAPGKGTTVEMSKKLNTKLNLGNADE